MKKVDLIVPILFVVALVAIFFFHGCQMDMVVTILAAVVVALATVARVVQNKKLKQLTVE
ncbi:MAG: hypothetical protein IJX86_08835 [Lachnospiraceae bacterium]|nr:hypothetical protein [Lachnospiraceae bacterium]